MKPDAKYRYDYADLAKFLNDNLEKNEKEAMKTMWWFGKNDLFFLLYFLLNRIDINHPWLVDRCYEVMDNHDHTLDMWPRFHYKSTINTIALTIQDIINFPNESNVIFSYTSGLAKKPLRAIKLTLQENELLKRLYPDVLYANPVKESPKWSEQDGLLVKRKSNQSELTLEAYGIIEQPTGPHWDHRIYDDCVTAESVWTPEQIAKTNEAIERSHALKSDNGTFRVLGTEYHFASPYQKMMKNDLYKLRFYAAEKQDGKGDYTGVPIYLTQEKLNEIRQLLGRDSYNCQMLLNPVAQDAKTFEMNWLKYYREIPNSLNVYITVDPADDKKKKSDYTVMCVIGVDKFKNYYLLDMIRDKFHLGERWIALRDLVNKWNPMMVGYEKYGKDSDIFYMNEKMIDERVIFSILDLGGNVPKTERIKLLQAPFEYGKFWLPLYLDYKDITGTTHDLIKELIQDEYSKMPFSGHDDMMDCMARIMDDKMCLVFPNVGIKEEVKHKNFDWLRMVGQTGSNVDWSAR
jgi:phage terminase large subunit-like protein